MKGTWSRKMQLAAYGAAVAAAIVACAPMEPTDQTQRGAGLKTGDAVPVKPKFKDDTFLCAPKGSPAAALLDATPGYTDTIQKLLADNCTACHKSGTQTPPDLVGYANAKMEAADSARRINEGTMPPGGMKQELRDVFSAWVAAGMPETAPAPTEPPQASDDATGGDEGGAATPAPAKNLCKPRGAQGGGATGGDTGGDTGGAAEGEAGGATDGETGGEAGGEAGEGDGGDMGAGDAADAAADGADAADADADGAADTADADGGADGNKPPVTNYNTDIKPYLTATCARAGCHVAGGVAPDLSNFAAAKAGGPRSLVRINAGTMPPGMPQGQAQKDLFKAWVDAGYPEAQP